MLLDQLAALDRGVFRPLLVNTLAAAPTAEQIQLFAGEHPDKYAAMVSVTARLAGYPERYEAIVGDAETFAQIGNLSDAELMDRLRSIDGKLDRALHGRAMVGDVVMDGEFTEVLDDSQILAGLI